jgi:hypothetical protein
MLGTSISRATEVSSNLQHRQGEANFQLLRQQHSGKNFKH